MFDSKFITTIFALIVAVVAICKFNKNSRESFGFGGLPSTTWKKDRVIAGNTQAAAKGDFYSVPGTYQALLNPRFSNVNYGSNIRYNLPNNDNLAVPCEPLSFGNMASQNYKENYANCSKNGTSKNGFSQLDSGFTDGNYADVEQKVMQGSQYPDVVDMVPVGDMTTVNSLGETIQPIVYDRFIYANRNSRLRSQGDPIRGDLPIVPCAADWFRPSVHPGIDLQEGAMNVMGGVDNSTTQALADLINASSGNTTIAGVNMASMKNVTTDSSFADVSVSAFP